MTRWRPHGSRRSLALSTIESAFDHKGTRQYCLGLSLVLANPSICLTKESQKCDPFLP